MITLYYEEADERQKKAIDFFRTKLFTHLDTFNPEFNCWIAGGALRSFFSDEEPRDYDVYFPNEESFNELLTYLRKVQFTIKYQSPLVVGLQSPAASGRMTELIRHSFFEDPELILEDFDYTISMCAVGRDTITYHDNYFSDLQNKLLKLENYNRPLASLKRLVKYTGYGYSIDDRDLFNLAQELSYIDYRQVDEENPFGMLYKR